MNLGIQTVKMQLQDQSSLSNYRDLAAGTVNMCKLM